ncbi:MAG: type 1 glutamine amidotransferase domain-containing protein [Acidobacteriota bacterium]
MNILMPLPSHDFDPTEVCVTWAILSQAGHTVRFATPDGLRAHADPLMISGQGLDPWGWIPGLRAIRLIGLMLRAQKPARQAYEALELDAHFRHPMSYVQAEQAEAAGAWDALVLPGGHAKGMRVYLESAVLQDLVARFFDQRDAQGRHRPVAAVCHGVLLAARSRSSNGRSVLWGRKTTALTWSLERSAWNLTRWWARFWDPLYYRTYAESSGEPAGYWSVEAEVKRALASDADFVDVPPNEPHHWRKCSGLVRDTPADDRAAWIVQDGAYLSARWPGDVHTFARAFAELLAHFNAGALGSQHAP